MSFINTKKDHTNFLLDHCSSCTSPRIDLLVFVSFFLSTLGNNQKLQNRFGNAGVAVSCSVVRTPFRRAVGCSATEQEVAIERADEDDDC